MVEFTLFALNCRSLFLGKFILKIINKKAILKLTATFRAEHAACIVHPGQLLRQQPGHYPRCKPHGRKDQGAESDDC